MRIPIAATLGNRDETTDKDERILNGVAESQGGRRKEDKSMVVKRPGTSSRYTLAAGQFTTSTFGQAIFVVNFPAAPGATGTTAPRLVGIRGDKLTSPVS
jgi:hypothetical protein